MTIELIPDLIGTLPTVMSAARFHSASGRLKVEQLPLPEVGPLDVLVRIRACGICLSDVHLIDGSLPSRLARVVPGHEAAGEIAAMGELVTDWRIGQRVVIAGGRPCWTCAACERGQFESCLRTQVMGFDFDGAWAQYAAVCSLVLTEVPEQVPYPQAAILADAVSTPYAGLITRARLQAGESVGLWGIGGLGVHAVRIAVLAGAGLIVALDPSPAARERALAAGAHHALDPGRDDVPAELERLTHGMGLDLAVDLAGHNSVLNQADACLGRYGRLLMIGLSVDPIVLGPGALFGVAGHSLIGHLGYGKADLDAVVDLVSTGKLDVSGSVSALVGLDEIVEAVGRLRDKTGDPIRLVLTP